MLKEVRTCDIFQTKADAVEVMVTIQIGDKDRGHGPVDMSERAIRRLVRFVDRGMSPPKKAE